jgi:hypothetical protein
MSTFESVRATAERMIGSSIVDDVVLLWLAHENTRDPARLCAAIENDKDICNLSSYPAKHDFARVFSKVMLRALDGLPTFLVRFILDNMEHVVQEAMLVNELSMDRIRRCTSNSIEECDWHKVRSLVKLGQLLMQQPFPADNLKLEMVSFVRTIQCALAFTAHSVDSEYYKAVGACCDFMADWHTFSAVYCEQVYNKKFMYWLHKLPFSMSFWAEDAAPGPCMLLLRNFCIKAQGGFLACPTVFKCMPLLDADAHAFLPDPYVPRTLLTCNLAFPPSTMDEYMEVFKGLRDCLETWAPRAFEHLAYGFPGDVEDREVLEKIDRTTCAPCDPAKPNYTSHDQEHTAHALLLLQPKIDETRVWAANIAQHAATLAPKAATDFLQRQLVENNMRSEAVECLQRESHRNIPRNWLDWIVQSKENLTLMCNTSIHVDHDANECVYLVPGEVQWRADGRHQMSPAFTRLYAVLLLRSCPMMLPDYVLTFIGENATELIQYATLSNELPVLRLSANLTDAFRTGDLERANQLTRTAVLMTEQPFRPSGMMEEVERIILIVQYGLIAQRSGSPLVASIACECCSLILMYTWMSHEMHDRSVEPDFMIWLFEMASTEAFWDDASPSMMKYPMMIFRNFCILRNGAWACRDNSVEGRTRRNVVKTGNTRETTSMHQLMGEWRYPRSFGDFQAYLSPIRKCMDSVLGPTSASPVERALENNFMFLLAMRGVDLDPLLNAVREDSVGFKEADRIAADMLCKGGTRWLRPCYDATSLELANQAYFTESTRILKVNQDKIDKAERIAAELIDDEARLAKKKVNPTKSRKKKRNLNPIGKSMQQQAMDVTALAEQQAEARRVDERVIAIFKAKHQLALDEQKAFDRAVDEQKAFDRAVDEQKALDRAADEQKALDRAADEQKALDRAVDEQKALDRAVDEQKALDRAADEQRVLQTFAAVALEQQNTIDLSLSSTLENWLCDAISMELFIDPVITSDGFTYEREYIEAWLLEHDTSPSTNELLENKKLVPNHVVKFMCAELRSHVA